MSRIGLITTSFPRTRTDDAGIFIQRLVHAYSNNGASDNGVSGCVIVPLDAEEPTKEDCAGFTVFRFRYGLFTRGRLAFGSGIMPNLRARPALVFQIPGLLLGFVRTGWLLRSSIDVFHANWIPATIAAWILRVVTRKPYIVTVRGEDVRLLEKWWIRPFFYLPLTRALRIVSVNQSFIDTLAAHYKISEDHFSYIPNGVEIPIISPEKHDHVVREFGLDGCSPYLVFVGSVVPRKRVEFLLDLLANELLLDVHLIVCGRLSSNTYTKLLTDRAAALGVSDRVHFKGAVEPDCIPVVLSKALAYVSASEFEGRPNAVLEACAMKCPAVVSDIPAHRELLQDGINGVIFDLNDLHSAARSIQQLRNDSEYRDSLTREAFSLAEENTWVRCAERYAELFVANDRDR